MKRIAQAGLGRQAGVNPPANSNDQNLQAGKKRVMYSEKGMENSLLPRMTTRAVRAVAAG